MIEHLFVSSSYELHFDRFKMLWEHHLKLYKLSLNSNSNRTTYKDFFGCSGTSLCSIWWSFFFEFLTPFTLGGCNFLFSNPFSTIVLVWDAPRGGIQVLLGHHKQQSPPLGSSLLWVLKCLVTGRSILVGLIPFGVR
jgi:hypothetical protein